MHVQKYNIVNRLDSLTQRLGVTMSVLSLGKKEVLEVRERSEWCSLSQGSNLRDREKEKGHAVGKNSLDKYSGVRIN